jgi:membrane protein
MKGTSNHYNRVTSLQDLQNYQKQLKHSYSGLGKGIKQQTGSSILNFLMTSVKQRITSKARLKDEKETFAVFTGSLANKMIKKVVPKKWGRLERWVLGLFVKKTVIRLIDQKTKSPPAQFFRSSPSTMDTLRIGKSNTKSIHMQQVQATTLNKEKLSFKGIWEVIKNSIKGFGEHKVTKISGSLAYYTVFSMAPLLVVVIALCGVFLEKEAAQGQIFSQLKGFLGAETAAQLQELIKKASIADKGVMASVIGGVTLLVGATTIFADIQDSINTIWGIKPKPKRGWLKLLMNRFLSFSVIVSLGFLLLVSLLVSTVLDGFSAQLEARFEDVSVAVFTILNTLVTLLVVSSIFGVIFKVLPDAKIRWKDIFSGAIVTAVLFMVGKLAISFYIGTSDVGSTYGAAGSLVILLLWAYYSSIILYFGAEFTKAYAVKYGEEIHPAAYAVTLREVEVEEGKQSVQEVEKSK